jgi:hypothetical protein
MNVTRRRFLGLAGGGTLLLASGGWSDATRAAPPPRGDRRLALISDLNSSYGSTSYVPEVQRGVELIQSLQPDLALCAGDMVAGQKRGLNPQQLDAMWNAFDRRLLMPLRAFGVPFAPAMGNHDASSTRLHGDYVFALDRQRAERFWSARRADLGLAYVDAGDFPFHYSFLQGGVFTLVLDASSAAISAERLRWAERQLAGPAAQQADLRLVMGHLPLHAVSQGRDRPGEVLDQPEVLRRLLERQGVHAYISGHQHAYFPGRVGEINLLNLGAMGSGPRRLLGDPRPPVQTLTLLDLFRGRGELVETTFNLRTLVAIQPAALPATLRPHDGTVIRRRELRMAISRKESQRSRG